MYKDLCVYVHDEYKWCRVYWYQTVAYIVTIEAFGEMSGHSREMSPIV